MNASRITAALSITLLLSFQPSAYSMDKNNKRASKNQWNTSLVKLPDSSSEIMQQVEQANTPPASPVATKEVAPVIPQSKKETTPPASPKVAPETEQKTTPQLTTATTQTIAKPASPTIADLLKQQKRPTFEVDSTWGNVFVSTVGLKGSYIPAALKGLTNLKASKTGGRLDISRPNHDTDWAINEIAGQIIAINDAYATKDQYTLRKIIDSAKPYIVNLREIVDLVNETNTQLIDTQLRKIQDTFDFFNTLVGSYTALAITEGNSLIRENKQRKKIAYALISKKTEDDALSEDEYATTDNLNDKIDNIILLLKDVATADKK